jgi:ABC-2 type transport system ATP-binding protein
VDADARELARRGFVALAGRRAGSGPAAGRSRWTPRTPRSPTPAPRRLARHPPRGAAGRARRPPVGVTGGSYGGALSLLLAGYDKRVDALAPVITWNDLSQALFPNAAGARRAAQDTPPRGPFARDGVFKSGWSGIFFSAGLRPGAGRTGPLDPTTGRPP